MKVEEGKKIHINSFPLRRLSFLSFLFSRAFFFVIQTSFSVIHFFWVHHTPTISFVIPHSFIFFIQFNLHLHHFPRKHFYIEFLHSLAFQIFFLLISLACERAARVYRYFHDFQLRAQTREIELRTFQGKSLLFGLFSLLFSLSLSQTQSDPQPKGETFY